MAQNGIPYIPDSTEVAAMIATAISTLSGTLAPIATSGSASDLSTGTIPAGRMPALTGDVVTVAGAVATSYALPFADITAEGLLAETFSRKNRGIATNVIVNGTIYFCKVNLFKGQSVANISAVITTKSTNATLAKLALYSKAGVQLAASASVHATFNGAAGLYTIAMGTPYSVPTNDGYYLAFITVGGTAPVVLGAAGALTGDQAAVVGAGVTPLGVQTGQSDLTSPATIAAGSGSAVSIWLAAS